MQHNDVLSFDCVRGISSMEGGYIYVEGHCRYFKPTNTEHISYLEFCTAHRPGLLAKVSLEEQLALRRKALVVL